MQPGDFVSYYVRARDLARGKRASEARSDIFFLEVKPFEQEFTLAQSQAMGGGGGNRQLDDLVARAEGDHRRHLEAGSAGAERPTARSPADDIRSVGRAEAELKTRVEETASAFRTSTMRDPRGQRSAARARRAAPSRRRRAPARRRPEEDAMTAAAAAMGKAVGSLNALKTGDALPPEMEALNHLLARAGRRQEARR